MYKILDVLCLKEHFMNNLLYIYIYIYICMYKILDVLCLKEHFFMSNFFFLEVLVASKRNPFVI